MKKNPLIPGPARAQPRGTSVWLWALWLAALSLPVGAADGPGFPNIDRPGQVNSVLSSVNTGKAVSAVMMHRGYLFVPMGADHGGGKGAGAFSFYDLSDPANPLAIFDSRDYPALFQISSSLHYAGDFAEYHSPVASGNLFLMSETRPSSAGFSILDVSNLYDSDPGTLPQVIGRYSFPNVTSPTNYDGYSFAPAWQGSRYVFAPTGANGLYIVDTTNPASPTLLAHRTRAQLSNQTLRAGVVIGNLLVLSPSAVAIANGRVLLFDVSDPANPTQIGSFTTPIGYQGFIYGSEFFGAADGTLDSYDFTNPASPVRKIYTTTAGATLDRPEYGFGKDGFLFLGHYPGMTKWDMAQNPAPLVATVAPQNPAADDYAFITPLGNLIAVTSDHSTTKKLNFGVHDAARDSLPPAVNFVSPANGSVNMNRKSRVGICFTDFIEASSIGTTTLIIRDAATRTTVPGSYSHMLGIVNFVPDQLLQYR